MDSFDRLNNDVICDDNITSAKCMGYLSRMRRLCEGAQVTGELELVSDDGCIDLPKDFFGESLHVGDRVRRWPCAEEVKLYYDQVYIIQSLELWEDGWHVNITDDYGCEYGSVGPMDVVKDCQPSVKNILLSFVLEFCGELRGGDDEILDKYADMLRVKEEQ